MPRTTFLCAAVLLLAAGGMAQRFGGRGGGLRFQGHDDGPPPVFPKEGEFHFIRLEYTDLPQFSRG